MKRRICALANALLLSFAVQAQVIINEYCAANMDGLTDNYGEHEDWVELYNAGTSTINLEGYFLSDNPNKPDKWQFPAGITIEPGEHLLVFCSDRDEYSMGFIHAGFKLTQTKHEYVVLSDAQQNTLDLVQITQPNQANHSTGRTTDAATDWGIFTNPTPGAPNANAKAGYAPTPSASHTAGFYQNPLTVTLDVPAGSMVRYTTDGSEPTATSNIYAAPLTINQTTVLKARAFPSDNDLLPGFTLVNTFFINDEHTVPVLSIAGDDLMTLLNGTQIEPRGSFEFFDNGQRIDFAYGEYNKHGNDSWAYSQRGIDYITRDQMGYTSSISHQVFPEKDRDKFQRLILKAAANDNYPALNDGAHIRDAYVHTLSQKADLELDERTYLPCVIYVNGLYWGVYEIREKVDDPDFTRHYYDQGEKWIDFIKTWGNTWEEYGSRQDWDDLYTFITTNDMSVPDNYHYAAERLNMLSLIDYFIINTHTVCKDWLNWNTAWWRGRKPEGQAKKWRYTLWDMDATFGHYINYTNIPDPSANADPCYGEDLPSDFEGHGQLIQSLMANEEFHSLYVNRYADLNNSFFTCDYMIGLLDSLLAVIEPEMPAHIDRWGGSYDQWQQNVQQLKDFIYTRCTVIDSGIEDCYEVEGPYPVTVIVQPENLGNKVRVNTIVPDNYPFVGDYFAGTNLSFAAQPQTGWVLDHWEVVNNNFAPDAFADTIQMALDSVFTDTVIAVFRPTVPCANAYNFSFDTTFSSIVAHWEGPANFISYEFGYRKAGSGDDWTTYSTTENEYAVSGLEMCTPYEIRVRSICDFALGSYEYFTISTACLNAVSEENPILEFYAYPNPYSASAKVNFVSSTDLARVSLEVYTLTGQLLQSRYFDRLAAGQHQWPIDESNDWPSGVYLLVLKSDAAVQTFRIAKR